MDLLGLCDDTASRTLSEVRVLLPISYEGFELCAQVCNMENVLANNERLVVLPGTTVPA